MSFVSRLFSKASPSEVAPNEASVQDDSTSTTTSNGLSPKPQQPKPPRPVGSILRQTSPPGETRTQQLRQETRRVSFSNAPVKVATIPSNPPKAHSASVYSQRNGASRKINNSYSSVPSRLSQPQPQSNISWFRSLFSSSTENNNSPSLLTNGNSPSLKSLSRHESQQNNIEKSCFRPLNNTELLENIPLALTQSFNGQQLRLTDWEQSLDEPETALDVADSIDLISSQDQSANNFSFLDLPPKLPFQLTQQKPFRLDSRKVGLLMLNKDGICGFNNIKSKPLELTLKKLLVQNIMEEVPTPKATTNPLLRTRASPQASKQQFEIPFTVTTSLTAESRSKTDKAHIQGVDLNKLEIDAFYNTIAEMIFGAFSIAQKPAKSMIDAEYANGAKLLEFKLHHLGTEWYDGTDLHKAEDLYISSFIIDAENANPSISGLPIQCGVAVLWLCPHSSNTSVFSSETVSTPFGKTVNPRNAELTLFNLLFNTPDFLMNTLQLFAYDLLNMGIANIRTCFYWMLYRLVDFMNAVRLKSDLDEKETIDSLVHLIQRYDNKEHFFFISNLLSTIFSFSYKQDRFKVVLWTSQTEKLPMMSQVATLINQFMVKSVHQVSDEMVITQDYQFVIPETLCTDFKTDDNEPANEANFETELFQPIPGSSCSSTLSTVTAIQVQAGISQAGSLAQAESSLGMISQSQPNGLRNYCNKADRKSRDESIGYDSLSESAFSGNISPVNNSDITSGQIHDEQTVQDFAAFQKIKHQRQQKQQQQSDELRSQLNVSQTTDYEESESSAFARSSDTDTTASSDENVGQIEQSDRVQVHYSASVPTSSFNQINKTQQNYFRGYVDLRYNKDGQKQEEIDEPENGSKIELTLPISAATDSSLQSQAVNSLSQCTATPTASSTPNRDDHQLSLPFSISSFQTHPSNVSHLANSPESHTPSGTLLLSATNAAASASLNSTSLMQIESTPFKTVSLHRASQMEEQSLLGCLSPAASALYHYSWLSLPVISCQHLNLLTTQVIFGETLQQASARDRNDDYPETYEYLVSRLSDKLKDEENNDTLFVVNCDTWAMHLLERALSEPCGPVMSSYLASALERVLSLATIESRKYDIWQYLRYTLTHLMLKSEVLQSVLTHDLHLLMKNRSVKRRAGEGEGGSNKDLLDIYINEETKEYARKVWAELMGDQTVNVYLTSDGPKAAFDLFRFRAPTSALYLFSDNNLSHFYLPSAITTRLLDFDSSDLLVIVGMRKLFLRSREPLITSMHGHENTKIFNYLLKYPQFSKTDQFGLKSKNWIFDQTANQRKFCPLYKTIVFNTLLADVYCTQRQTALYKTTFFSFEKKQSKNKENTNEFANQNVLLLQQ